MACSQKNAYEYRGKIGEGGGEHSIGQSSWKYESGNFIVNGGDAGKLYYMIISDAPWGSFEAFDYPPNSPGYKGGGFELIKDGKVSYFRFKKNQLLILMVSMDLSVVHEYLNITPEDWRAFMQPYANSLKDTDYDQIKQFFQRKIKGGR
ncbi:hypothetical protein DSCW_16290 [Desulfosarcina widdelii]|uniref:Uncharacterized protein n=2 Tax=Desulfosarcina widdelii TaxID=947919 RepID=A0A5K7YWS4_9BACT|nr:hypothetical protein DSCW_16290 [Desulfosarcina widdelii]